MNKPTRIIIENYNGKDTIYTLGPNDEIKTLVTREGYDLEGPMYITSLCIAVEAKETEGLSGVIEETKEVNND